MNAFARRHAAWLILALALALRCVRLSAKNLWLDESASWDLATSTVDRLIAWTAGDVHPPLYYVLLKGWVALFGDSLAAMRSLSVVASVVALGLFYRLALGFMSRGVALTLLLWGALSPHSVYHAQEVRMYAPVTALVLGAALAYRAWVDSGFRRHGSLALYALCATCALYMHYFTVLVLVALSVHFLLLSFDRESPAQGDFMKRWARWVGAHLVVLVAYLPWIRTAIAQLTKGQAWRAPVGLAQMPAYAANLIRTFALGPYDVPSFYSIPAVLAFPVLLAGIGFLLVVVARRGRSERDVFAVCVGILPIAIGLALLPKSGHMDLSRYLAYSGLRVLFAAARGLSSFATSEEKQVYALLVACAAVVPSLRAYVALDSTDADARPLVAYLQQQPLPGTPTPGPGNVLVVGHLMSAVRYIARDSLSLKGGYSSDAVVDSLGAKKPDRRPAWIIVDYRWPAFETLTHDARAAEVDVAGGMRGRIRLFRVVP